MAIATLYKQTRIEGSLIEAVDVEANIQINIYLDTDIVRIDRKGVRLEVTFEELFDAVAMFNQKSFPVSK